MKYKKKTLSNGLRIILVPIPSALTVMVEVAVGTGSEYEKPVEAGISHFLEHMCFKGTTNRPSSFIIAREMDEIGAIHNAATGSEYTSYYSKADARHAGKILDIIADSYLNSTFPAEEIEKEKGVVIEEIHMYEDDPQSKVWDVLRTLMYGDQAAGRPVLGYEPTVKAMSRSSLIAYRKRHYVPENTVVIVSGNFDEASVLQAIRASLGKLPAGGKAPAKFKVKAKQTSPAVAIEHRPTDQTHFVMSFRGIPRSHALYWPARMLQTVLSGGLSSRIWYKMREELGICYYASAYDSNAADYGEFGVSAGVGNGRLEEAITEILAELRKIKTELVPDAELSKAMDYRTGKMYLGLETSDAWGDFYGFQELIWNRIQTPEEMLKEMKQVTAEDIRRAANLIFDERTLNLAVVGPHKDKKKLLKLLRVQVCSGS
jgi:predicted Zn-dependent peptidase